VAYTKADRTAALPRNQRRERRATLSTSELDRRAACLNSRPKPRTVSTRRDSVFMAFCSTLVVSTTPFWRQNAVFAHSFWLRLRRVRMMRTKSRIEKNVDANQKPKGSRA
jgi:hypothetical protein